MAWVLRGLREGVVTTPYPARRDRYGDAFPGAVGVNRHGPAPDPAVLRICPTGAISRSEGRVTLDRGRCILCGACADICPEFCFRLVDVADLRGDSNLEAAVRARYGGVPKRGEQAAIIKDETRCIRCGLCAMRCPTGAITMERAELVPA